MCQALINPFKKIGEIDPIFKASSKLGLRAHDKLDIGSRILRKQGFAGGDFDFGADILAAGAGEETRTNKLARTLGQRQADAQRGDNSKGVPAHVRVRQIAGRP